MNYLRILSKSSLQSSSSLKSETPSEEVTKLQTEIENLKQTVESLKLTVEGRDAAIGTLAREKEKLFVELKSAQRTNRNLHQQLEDERDMHSKEKDFLIEEIKRVATKNGYENNNDFLNSQGHALNNMIKEEMRSKDEVICNICAKYLKIKQSKMLLHHDFKELQRESQKACEKIITLLEGNKKTLDDLLQKIIEYSNVPPDSKKYFKILRHNAKLHYENTQMKVRLTSSVHTNFIQRQRFTGNQTDKIIEMEKNSHHEVRELYKKCCKPIHHKIVDTKIRLYTTSPFLFNKSNSDTCLNLLRK